MAVHSGNNWYSIPILRVSLGLTFFRDYEIPYGSRYGMSVTDGASITE